MCRVIFCVVGRGCFLWPVHSLGKTLLDFALLHFVLQGQTYLLLQVSLDFLLLHSSPLWWKGHILGVLVLESLGGHNQFSSVTQLCPTLCDPMDCSTPGFPVHRKLSELTPKKRYPFQGQKCQSKKSRDTWSNRQICPWSTKWSRAKANRVLPRERSGHSKHPLPTTREMALHMDITSWSILKSAWLYSLQPKIDNLYTVSKNKTGSWLWLRSWTLYCKIQT